jgi:ArsR family transcriptional regulator
MDADRFFEALADATRRQILAMLLAHDERCVCDFTAALDSPQPKVSRHLAVLRDAGLVLTRRDGVWMHYRLNPGMPAWMIRVLWHMKEGMASLPEGSCESCAA